MAVLALPTRRVRHESAYTAALQSDARARLSYVDVLRNPCVPLPASDPSVSLPVEILGETNGFEVLRSNASANVAGVVDLQTIWYGANPQFVGQPVREDRASSVRSRELPITMTSNAAAPQPAGITFGNAGEQSFFEAPAHFALQRHSSANVAVLLPPQVVGVAPSARPSAVSAAFDSAGPSVNHEAIIHVERSGV